MKPTHTQFTGMALAVLSANFFSSKVLLVKLAFAEGATPMQVLGIRMATALPFFAGIFLAGWLWSGKPVPGGRDYAGMTILGLIGYYVSSVLDFHGMQYVSSGMERLLLYLYPTFLVVLRSSMEKSLPGRREVLALAIAYAGTGLVYFDEQKVGTLDALKGSVLVLGSALCYATYLYFSSGYIKRFGSWLFASYSTAVSCVAILIHVGLTGSLGNASLNSTVIIIGVIIGIFCTVVPAYAMHLAISLVGSARVGMLGTTGILCPLFVGILLFNEPLTAFRVAGAGCVVLSVLVLGWRKR